LCAKHAFDELPSNLSFLLSEVAKWFKFSSQRRDAYQTLFQAMNANTPDLSPTRFLTPSRWLVNGKVIYAILTQWHELQVYFKSLAIIKNCSSRMLQKMLSDMTNYLYLVFVLPLIIEFKLTNSSFQHSIADQCQLFQDLHVFYRSLRSRICKEAYVDMLEPVVDFQLRSSDEVQFGSKFSKGKAL